MKTAKTELPDSLVLVLFGGSGDLTRRKLIPSLYQLYVKHRLPQRFAIVGVARTNYEDDTYRAYIKDNLKEYLSAEEYNEEQADTFLSYLYYYAMDPAQEADYTGLKTYLQEKDNHINNPANYIFYLATPPVLYGVIPQHLSTVKLNQGNAYGKEGIRRIIIEKPFGYDLKSAQELTKIYTERFQEDQLYRIDHFLGKETVQNIMALRFANGIFEPLWNRNYVDRIEVTAVENMGIGTRGGFYDHVGALRDMVQNHLVQLLALTAMEPPAVFNAQTFRDEVAKVYQSIRPLSKEDIHNHVIRGQYTASESAEGTLNGYREEDKVSPDSRTETFVAMRLFIDNWRWGGVPFYIRTGKQMPTKVTEIVVHFRETPHTLFGSNTGAGLAPNSLTIRIQPNEGTVLKFGMKVPGSGFEVQQVSMDFSYDTFGGVPSGDAYSRLLEDCMLGDPTLFTRSDAVEASWRFFSPILEAWQEDASIPLYGYPAKTWGPKEANSIMTPGNFWTNPCKNLTNTNLYCEL